MKYYILILLVISHSTMAETQSAVESEARDWYENDYGALWYDSDLTKPEIIRTYYLDNYRVHLPGGGFEIVKNTIEDWQTFKESVGPDWIGSAIQHLKIVAINTSSVSIRAQWKNMRRDGTYFVSCDSYIAAKTKRGNWIFTNYLVVECDSLESIWN